MPRQFNREATALIGVGDEQVEIQGLRMAFEVTKSRLGGSLPNSCVLNIYNLAPTTRARIKDKGTSLRLFAGYEGRVELLYSGQLRRVIHERERAEWISRVYCSDLYKPMQEATISVTFASGTPAKTIIRAVVDSFGVTENEPLLYGLEGLPALLGSRSLSGASKTAMEQLAQDYKFDWAWQDGRMEVSGQNAHFKDEAVVISPDTGMIGHPIVTDQGIEVTTLLNPRIRVKRKIRIQSRAAALRVANIEVRASAPSLHNGDYVVSEVVFSGDTWGNDWLSRVRTQPKNAPPT